MTTETTLDIGERASLALTALTDPGAVPEPYGPELQRREARATSPDDEPFVTFACDMLNGIIGVTDPVDDERELERCADSLDVLGRAIERIREQATGDHGPIRDGDERTMVSHSVTLGLDHIDDAVSTLRRIHEDQERADYACEDCAVNGLDCPVHGEAAKLAARAIAQSPDGVIAALRNAGLGT